MDEARDLCQRALALAERLGLVEVQAESLTTIGLLPNQTSDEARAAFERAIALAESAQLLATAARAHFNIAGNVFEHGNTQMARAHFERARDHAHHMGMTAWEFEYLSQIINISLNLGEIERAEADLATLHELHKTTTPQPWAVYLVQLGEGILAYFQGHLTEALELLQAGKLACTTSGVERKFVHEFNGTLIQLFILEKKFVEAEQLVRESLELAHGGLEANHIFFNGMLCIVLTGQGRLAEAHEALEAARRPPASKKYGKDSPLFIQLMRVWPESYLATAEQRWPEAMAAFEATQQALNQLGWRWHSARFSLGWADAYLARGQSGDCERAAGLLTQARAEFEAMHLSHFAQMTQEQLNAISTVAEKPVPISGD
jgi:tetratricopeptide (TPR) repeat protein